MSKEEFISKVLYLAKKEMSQYPFLRKGQSVFNVVAMMFSDSDHNIASKVQYEDKVDCFYDDSQIDKFLDKCYERLKLLKNG